MGCAAPGKAEGLEAEHTSERNPIAFPSTDSMQSEAAHDDFLKELRLSAYAAAAPVETKNMRYQPPAVPSYATRTAAKIDKDKSGGLPISPAQHKQASQLPERSDEAACKKPLPRILTSGKRLCFSFAICQTLRIYLSVDL